MRDLPIHLLRTFLMVAKTLNLTEASKLLHKAPSTISMQLSRLEELVGSTLMERGQHGVRLTPPGIQLTAHAQQLLNLHDQIVGSFQNMDIDGAVRLGSHDQYASRTLSPLLQEFVLSYPEVELEVFCDHSPDTLLRRLDKGLLDIALVEMMADSEGGVRLRRDALVWVGSRDHNLISQRPLPLAVFNEGCNHRLHATELLKDAGISHRIAFTSQSRAGVLAAVRAGIGIGIIPLHTLEDDLIILHEGLPPLPETEVALYTATNINEATKRLERIILDSPVFNSMGST